MPDPSLDQRFFLRKTPVTRETYPQLELYAQRLKEWSGRFNLVAESTLPHIWTRHFLDSAQLMPHLSGVSVLADLGSGAGFPGLVLAIFGVPEVHLIESIGKKADFLRAMTEELGLSNVTIHQKRIENITNPRADVITARALKALPELLSLAKPLMRANAFGLFLKGQKADAELTEARKYWRFNAEIYPSLSDKSGSVLKITELKTNHDAHRVGKKRKHRSRG